MTKAHSLSLHIFRRDLRLADNSALIEACKTSQQVIPCFIFDPKQVENNSYKSHHSIQFMIHSLRELAEELKKQGGKLYCFYGAAEEVIETLLQRYPIRAVFINRDYTPFSKQRDHSIKKVCDKHHVSFHCLADALLNEPEQVLKKDKQPYTIFTAAFRQASLLPIAPPVNNAFTNYYNNHIELDNPRLLDKFSPPQNSDLFVKGGRQEGLRLLKKANRLVNYEQQRDFPALASTTSLSAHLKFGTLSIRECYSAIVNAFDKQHMLIRELYWRDFFTHIAYHFPRVFIEPFHQQYKKIRWENNPKKFSAWCKGMTGFPIVDAGMRQLNATGFMHNRVRMITASFLTKDLHIDWRWGEKYFAQQLVDYDPAVNNGNWQWAASTGCDAQPYFRIFNPWLQQEKYDLECAYIKHWIPELANLPAKLIHRWYQQSSPPVSTYPLPLVDHASQAQKAKLLYKQGK